MNFGKDEAIDTDQSVTLMGANVSIATDRGHCSNTNVYYHGSVALLSIATGAVT